VRHCVSVLKSLFLNTNVVMGSMERGGMEESGNPQLEWSNGEGQDSAGWGGPHVFGGGADVN